MSKRNNRLLAFFFSNFSSFRNLKCYQIKLGLCGCYLNDDYKYLRHPISVYISTNLNNDYNTHCYLDKNQDKEMFSIK